MRSLKAVILNAFQEDAWQNLKGDTDYEKIYKRFL